MRLGYEYRMYRTKQRSLVAQLATGLFHRTPLSNSVCAVCCRRQWANYGLVLFVVLMPYNSLVFVCNLRNLQKLGPIYSEYRSILPVLSSSNRSLQIRIQHTICFIHRLLFFLNHPILVQWNQFYLWRCYSRDVSIVLCTRPTSYNESWWKEEKCCIMPFCQGGEVDEEFCRYPAMRYLYST